MNITTKIKKKMSQSENSYNYFKILILKNFFIIDINY